MSSRPQFSPFLVIEDGNMGGDITSEVTIIQKLSLISYGISWSGSSPVGEMIVEVSNDYEQNVDGSVKVAGNWTPLPLDTTASVSGNIDSGFIDIDLQGGFALRLRYDRTSGTGTMQATVSAKVA